MCLFQRLPRQELVCSPLTLTTRSAYATDVKERGGGGGITSRGGGITSRGGEDNVKGRGDNVKGRGIASRGGG